jgi:sugar lactone lactonase YvrE
VQTPDVLMTGIVFEEQPRWHDGRLWFSDWGAREVIAVDLDGTAEVMHRGSSFPLCVDWLPDGRLLVVDTSRGCLLVQEADGSLETYAAPRQGSDPPAINELVVDGRGNAYVNGGGFDMMAGEPYPPGGIVLVTADGTARQVGNAAVVR